MEEDGNATVEVDEFAVPELPPGRPLLTVTATTVWTQVGQAAQSERGCATRLKPVNNAMDQLTIDSGLLHMASHDALYDLVGQLRQHHPAQFDALRAELSAMK